MKNSPARKAIFDLMLLYNKKLKENNYVDFKDMSLIVLDYLKKLNNIKKYTHIIIDESQDLTRVQLEILNLLYNVKNYSSITFIADTAQSIYNHSWLVKGRSFTSIGYDMTGKSNQLTKNYRTTAQIAKCAYSLIEKDTNIIEDENFVKPSLIDRQGALPVFKIFDSIQEEAKFIANEIKNNLSKDYNLRDIAIVCKIKKYLDEINSYLKDSGIEVNFLNKENPQFEENSVKLLTMHSIKGLEFKIVFAVGLNKKIIPSINFSDIIDVDAQETVDRKLLYVAMTRANEMLYLTSSETPSKFIDDIDKNYLRISSSSNIKKFYKIKTEDFLFTNKIINIYSKEELVRQWLLKELIETYKYPIELIDVEYKINTFSKVGMVDVAIFIYKNNKKIPFIFFETKSFNSKTNSALEQLKSYLNCSSCFYGATTDGNNFIVIDRNGNIIDDIPFFDTSMLPTGIEEYTYIDLKHCRTFEIKRNINDISNISILEQGEETQLKENETIKLNIYSKIAAGSPIPICNDKVSDFFLPENIVSSSANHYILKVKGDSMIGAQIDDGDLVVIQKTNSAENRDIVAVSLGEEATLKRFTRMGGSVLLIPENPKYEPINIRDEQARILGIAVGIIKKKS
ncbi:MAG: type I restriction enzyme HsdR N-terminal domain-containing protein [Caloramator sp.]|nr:type I restriction enzyme HsdR N-terminal domain-containing protein [Caloramator sp.]